MCLDAEEAQTCDRVQIMSVDRHTEFVQASLQLIVL